MMSMSLQPLLLRLLHRLRVQLFNYRRQVHDFDLLWTCIQQVVPLAVRLAVCCTTCCGFVLQHVVQQIKNMAETPLFRLEESLDFWTKSCTTSCTACWHVKMLRTSFDLLWICRSACCTTNPQQVEVSRGWALTFNAVVVAVPTFVPVTAPAEQTVTDRTKGSTASTTTASTTTTTTPIAESHTTG